MEKPYSKFVKMYKTYQSHVSSIINKNPTLRQFYKLLEKLKNEKSSVRSAMQEIANKFYSERRMRHYPVYLSDKYKIKKAGMAFKRGARPTGATLFYLRSFSYIKPDERVKERLFVRNADDLLRTLAHELEHLFDYEKLGYSGHSVMFDRRTEQTYRKIKSFGAIEAFGEFRQSCEWNLAEEYACGAEVG